jgi:hypothetical protein
MFVEQQEYKIMGLEHDKEKLEKALEENKATTLALEVIREEAMNLNDNMNLEKKKCFCILNVIHRNIDDQIRLEDQIDEIKDMYQKDNNYFDRIIYWRGVYKDPCDTLPTYSNKQKLKGQVFLTHGNPYCRTSELFGKELPRPAKDC